MYIKLLAVHLINGEVLELEEVIEIKEEDGKMCVLTRKNYYQINNAQILYVRRMRGDF
jgi:hypothetical protein